MNALMQYVDSDLSGMGLLTQTDTPPSSGSSVLTDDVIGGGNPASVLLDRLNADAVETTITTSGVRDRYTRPLPAYSPPLTRTALSHRHQVVEHSTRPSLVQPVAELVPQQPSPTRDETTHGTRPDVVIPAAELSPLQPIPSNGRLEGSSVRCPPPFSPPLQRLSPTLSSTQFTEPMECSQTSFTDVRELRSSSAARSPQDKVDRAMESLLNEINDVIVSDSIHCSQPTANIDSLQTQNELSAVVESTTTPSKLLPDTLTEMRQPADLLYLPPVGSSSLATSTLVPKVTPSAAATAAATAFTTSVVGSDRSPHSIHLSGAGVGSPPVVASSISIPTPSVKYSSPQARDLHLRTQKILSEEGVVSGSKSDINKSSTVASVQPEDFSVLSTLPVVGVGRDRTKTSCLSEKVASIVPEQDFSTSPERLELQRLRAELSELRQVRHEEDNVELKKLRQELDLVKQERDIAASKQNQHAAEMKELRAKLRSLKEETQLTLDTQKSESRELVRLRQELKELKSEGLAIVNSNLYGSTQSPAPQLPQEAEELSRLREELHTLKEGISSTLSGGKKMVRLRTEEQAVYIPGLLPNGPTASQHSDPSPGVPPSIKFSNGIVSSQPDHQQDVVVKEVQDSSIVMESLLTGLSAMKDREDRLLELCSATNTTHDDIPSPPVICASHQLSTASSVVAPKVESVEEVKKAATEAIRMARPTQPTENQQTQKYQEIEDFKKVLQSGDASTTSRQLLHDIKELKREVEAATPATSLSETTKLKQLLAQPVEVSVPVTGSIASLQRDLDQLKQQAQETTSVRKESIVVDSHLLKADETKRLSEELSELRELIQTASMPSDTADIKHPVSVAAAYPPLPVSFNDVPSSASLLQNISEIPKTSVGTLPSGSRVESSVSLLQNISEIKKVGVAQPAPAAFTSELSSLQEELTALKTAAEGGSRLSSSSSFGALDATDTSSINASIHSSIYSPHPPS